MGWLTTLPTTALPVVSRLRPRHLQTPCARSIPCPHCQIERAAITGTGSMDDGQAPTWPSSDGHASTRMRPARRGLLIAVLGPDGAGKTTFIERLRAELQGLFDGAYCQHVRPRLFGRRDDPNPTPHAAKPHGRFKSLLKLLYLVADYRLGYLARTRPALLRSHACISDRYYQDLLVDPLRYGYTAPMAVVRALEWVVPAPDAMFVLTAPASVIRSRKDELPVDECERQLEAYRALAGRYPNAWILDATQPPASMARQARLLISRYLEQRR